MASLLVFVMVFVISVKTASYGMWEARRKNIYGGGFAITLAVFNLILAGRYVIKYWA